jgi:hypothetical protein
MVTGFCYRCGNNCQMYAFDNGLITPEAENLAGKSTYK